MTFKSKDSSNPAKFYINSATAHKGYKTQLITIDGRKGSLKANSFAAGKLEESNDRVINQLIVNNVLEEGPCQLQMGLTELKPGSVWNTMPAHTHSRRVEAYFYFNVPAGNAICHFMGEPQEERIVWMQNEQAIMSPEWSIHAAAGTSNYMFIWGMQVKTLTTETWTRSNIQKCANRCVFLFMHIINDPKKLHSFLLREKGMKFSGFYIFFPQRTNTRYLLYIGCNKIQL